MSYVQREIEARYIKLGVSPEVARCEAGKEIAMLVAMGLISPKALEAVDRDAKAYVLRGQGLTAVMIAIRLSMSRPERAFEAVRRHHDRLRRKVRLVA